MQINYSAAPLSLGTCGEYRVAQLRAGFPLLGLVRPTPRLSLCGPPVANHPRSLLLISYGIEMQMTKTEKPT